MDKYLKSKNKTQINNSINNKFDFSNEFPIDSCVNQEKSVLSDIQTKDLDKLDSCLNHIQNNIEILPQISNFNKYEEVFIDIKNSLLHADSIEVFNQIYEKLDKIINKMIFYYNLLIDSDHYEEQKNEILDFFEKTFFLFIFHFSSKICTLGFEIIYCMLSTIDYQFHNELMEKCINLLKLLMNKRRLNLLLSNQFIYNLSQTIAIILHNSNDEIKRKFLNFIQTNNDDLMSIYFICSPTNNDYNYSKFFPFDIIMTITEKYYKDFEKQMFIFEGLINEIKKQKNNSILVKIKQSLNSISVLAKIIDSFLIRGNRTYNYSKLIQNLLRLMKNLWQMLLITDINEIDFSIESFQNLLLFYDNLESLSFDKKLIVFAVISKLFESNPKYTITMNLVVQILFSKTKIPQNSEKDIICKIYSIIDTHLALNKKENYDYILLIYFKIILDVLSPFNKLHNILNESYLNIKEFTNNFQSELVLLSEIKDDEYIFNSVLKDYCTILNEDKSLQNLERKLKVKYALDKLNDYKNSLKDLFNIKTINLCIDNKIENYTENIKINPEKDNDIEGFLLESSIQLYKEIIQNTIK